jgi:hypothetical protein
MTNIKSISSIILLLYCLSIPLPIISILPMRNSFLNIYSKKRCTGASFFTERHIGYYNKGFLSDRIEMKEYGSASTSKNILFNRNFRHSTPDNDHDRDPDPNRIMNPTPNEFRMKMQMGFYIENEMDTDIDTYADTDYFDCNERNQNVDYSTRIKPIKPIKSKKNKNKKTKGDLDPNHDPYLYLSPEHEHDLDVYSTGGTKQKKTSSSSSSSSASANGIYTPRTKNQQLYTSYLSDPNVQIVVVYGSAGTGKTMFACQEAIHQLKTKQIDKIILTRPLISVDKEDIGFLPGTLESKMDPWTRPIFDILLEQFTKHELNHMIEKRTIEIAPLAYMRGRTFKRAFIIADEMQNSSPTQMLMMLTRIGEDTKLVVTGDLLQSDRPSQSSHPPHHSHSHSHSHSHPTNGLQDLIEKVKSYKSYLNEVTEAGELNHEDIDNVGILDENGEWEVGKSSKKMLSFIRNPRSRPRNSIEMIEMKTKDVERSDIVKKVLHIYGGKISIQTIPK